MFNPPRQKRSRESLERYLDSAECLIRRDGFSALNVTDVARSAGFSVGGLYSRFPNKMALLAAVRQRFLDRVEGALEAEYQAGAGSDQSLRAALERMIHMFFTHFMREREIFRAFVVETPSNPGFETRGEEATERRKEMFRRALMAHAPEIRRPAPEAAVEWVFTLFMALVRERLVYGESAVIAGGHSDEELLSRLIEMSFLYLSCPDGAGAAGSAAG